MEMEGHDFEYYCADLLRYNGQEDVEATKGSGKKALRIRSNCKNAAEYIVA
jgi:hypothetical protein